MTHLPQRMWGGVGKQYHRRRTCRIRECTSSRKTLYVQQKTTLVLQINVILCKGGGRVLQVVDTFFEPPDLKKRAV